MVIDFQAHVFPESYIAEMDRLDGEVVLEAPDPHSGMRYFFDRKLGCRINTATFQGQNIDRRLQHMDQLGIDVHVLTIPALTSCSTASTPGMPPEPARETA